MYIWYASKHQVWPMLVLAGNFRAQTAIQIQIDAHYELSNQDRNISSQNKVDNL